MEGMISGKILEVQAASVDLGQCTLSLNNWAKGLVVKLMEVTHGQWLYRNVLVHDETCGAEMAKRKELLQLEIERQIELGGDGLDEQDRYLLEINLSDLECSSGEDQYYWMISIQAARKDRRLKVMEKNRTTEQSQEIDERSVYVS